VKVSLSTDVSGGVCVSVNSSQRRKLIPIVLRLHTPWVDLYTFHH